MPRSSRRFPRVLAALALGVLCGTAAAGGRPDIVLSELQQPHRHYVQGELLVQFEPGAADAQDPVFRALAVFEDPQYAPSDFHVRGMIELLTRSRVRVRQGAGSTWVEAPVDFSDLSSEYIGILYEGVKDLYFVRLPVKDIIKQ